MGRTRERVLVIDDEETVRRLCGRALSGLGLDVETVGDGEAALGRLGQAGFDLVVTDISLPGMDGTALVEEVRRRRPSTSVIIMTGFPSVESAVSTLKLGACDYLPKPFGPQGLRRAVAGVLAKRKLASDLDRETSLRRELSAAYEELQEVRRLKDAVVSRVSHELRTPLAVALGAARLLREEPGLRSAQSRRFLDLLDSSLERELRQVESLLLYSRLSGKGLPLNVSEIDLVALLGGLAEDCRVLTEERGVSLSVSIEPGARLLRADAALVGTALRQLLVNAIQFNKRGGRVRVAAKAEGEAINLSFADTGPAIPAEKMTDVFDSFYQAADHLTREVGGLGLGLAIVRRIAEAHDGAVFAVGRAGVGNTFTIVLPKAVAETLLCKGDPGSDSWSF